MEKISEKVLTSSLTPIFATKMQTSKQLQVKNKFDTKAANTLASSLWCG